MALNVGFGGDPESYMDPPRGSLEGLSGGPSFIAGLLDMLGVHKQVAAEPAKPESTTSPGKSGDAKASGPAPAPSSVSPELMKVLDDAESAFKPMFGAGGMQPLKGFDPSIGF